VKAVRLTRHAGGLRVHQNNGTFIWSSTMARTANSWAAAMSPETENVETFLLTYDEAARLLRVCKRSVERMVERRELPVVYVGRLPRVPRAELMRWLERATAAAVKPSKEIGNGECGF
jgi:excisionase family DNA binding protein